MKDTKTAQTPLDDLKKSALEHYEKAASAVHHHDSFVVAAIKAYNPGFSMWVESRVSQLSSQLTGPECNDPIKIRYKLEAYQEVLQVLQRVES